VNFTSVDVVYSSPCSSDSAAYVGGVCNNSSNQAHPKNCMPPPPNPPSGLIASQHFLLDSHEQALGVSLVQPPLEICVPSNCTSSVSPVSQPVDPVFIAQIPAAAPAPENHQQPSAHASSESAVSGKVNKSAVSGKMDYGPVKDCWLKYSLQRG